MQWSSAGLCYAGESERKRARVATARGAARMHSARLYYCDAFTEMLMRGLYCIYYYTVQNTHTYLQHLSKELLSKLSKNKEGCFIIKTYDNFESFLL